MEGRLQDRDFLQHIQKAILELKAHTAGMTFEAYAQDTKTQRAVERNLEIVGEASKNLSEALKQTSPDVPWSSVYGARNRLVHFYFGVDQKIVWDILQQDLDVLLGNVQELLRQTGEPEADR